MAKNTKSVPPLSAISLPAARVALGSGITFVVLLVLLHFLKSDLDPSWHFISEYALGDFGWMMIAAFLALSVGYMSLFVALKSQVRTVAGKVGLALLLISSLGLSVAGLFVTDPITTAAADKSTAGQIHEIGALLDLTPFVAPLLAWSLVRRNPNWAAAKRILGLTSVLPLIGLIVFSSATAAMVKDGKFGPDVLVGWPNRFLIATYCVWFIVLAWQTIKLRSHSKVA